MTVDEAARNLLEHLSCRPMARKELLNASGIPERLWLPAIRLLVDSGAAVKTGRKRGTRYLAGDCGFEPVDSSDYGSRVSTSYCGLVEKVLNDISVENRNGGASPRSQGVQQPRPGDQPVGSLDEEDDEEEVTEEVLGVVSMLRARGVSILTDHRHRGGCLWVVEGPGVAHAVKSVAAALGVRFYYKAEGSRSTKGRAAWWTVAD